GSTVTCASQLRRAFPIRYERSECSSQGTWIAVFDEQSGHPIRHHFGGSSHSRCDDRAPERHCLEDGHRQAFFARREHKAPGTKDPRRNVPLPSDKGDEVGESQRLALCLELLSF